MQSVHNAPTAHERYNTETVQQSDGDGTLGHDGDSHAHTVHQPHRQADAELLDAIDWNFQCQQGQMRSDYGDHDGPAVVLIIVPWFVITFDDGIVAFGKNWWFDLIKPSWVHKAAEPVKFLAALLVLWRILSKWCDFRSLLLYGEQNCKNLVK